MMNTSDNAEDVMERRHFEWPDYVVFVLVVVISAAIGVYHGCTGGKQKTIVEYLLANRSLQWLPVGLSILVTYQSAILYTGVPAEMYTKGNSYLLFHIGMGLAVLLTARFFVPLFFPLKLTSVYQYLFMRFDSKAVQIVGCLLGMLNMSLYMGVVVFAAGITIQAVSNIPAWGAIVLLAALATFYTSLGGLRGVVWTDVFQFLIMTSGLLAVIIKGTIMQGGSSRIWSISVSGGRDNLFDWNPDPRVRHTIWSLVIGGTFNWMANIAVNQASVQRFSSVQSIREATLSVLVGLPGFIIFGVLASWIGLIVFSYFYDVGCDPLQSKKISNPNQLVPLFVVEVFDFLPGFAGLYVASLISAAMSTVSSSINSLSAMLWSDIVQQKIKVKSEYKETIILKVFVIFFGLVATGVAFLALEVGGPATQIALSFIGVSGGPLLGLYFLGGLFPRANWIGAIFGALTALIVGLWISIGNFLAKINTSLPPGPSHNCPITNGNYSVDIVKMGDTMDLNTTTSSIVFDGTSVSDDNEPWEINVYKISYLWYSFISILITLIVGLSVSFCTGPTDPSSVDSSLLFPLVDQVCCCLPEKTKAKMRRDNVHVKQPISTSDDEDLGSPKCEKKFDDEHFRAVTAL